MNELEQLVNKYPNNEHLGEMLRLYIICETDENIGEYAKQKVDPEFKEFFDKILK